MQDSADRDTRSYVIFRAGGEEYGVAIGRVQGIVRYETPTPVPKAPELVLGVINLRGQVIPVVDLARRFGTSSFALSSTSRIVVTEGDAGTVGLAVDAANEVAAIPIAEIRKAPDGVLTAETAEAFEGVVERDGGLVILLDLDKSLPRSEYARLAGDTEPEGETDV